MADIQDNEFLVDLFDEDGNKKVFEHLDTVMYKNEEYVIFIPYDDDEKEVTEIVIFKTVTDDKGESALEQIFEPDIMADVYDIFRERNADKFDFED